MRKWYEFTGEQIIHTLLEHSGATWRELQGHLGLAERDAPGSVVMNLYNLLWALASAGLIVIDGVPKNETTARLSEFTWMKDNERKMRASDAWIAMRAALTADLSMGTKRAFTMTVSPLFGKPENPPKQADIFVVMPFTKEHEAIYRDHIAPAITNLNLTVARASEYLTVSTIMSEVWNGLCGCGVVLADCSGRNPNVFYEIGVAHAIGKPVVLITSTPDDVPADLRQMRFLRYEFTPRGMKQFEIDLQRTVHKTLGMYEPLAAPERFPDIDVPDEPSQTVPPTLGRSRPAERVKILFLAANPAVTTRLGLDEEARAIKNKIRAAEHRDAFEFITEWAVRPDDLLQALNEHRPHIVHFSGHGSESKELFFAGEDGAAKAVGPRALGRLFLALGDNVRVVVLNACWSSGLAKSIAKSVDCVVGMRQAIGDRAAMQFAASFYRALAFGRSVQNAFEQGRVALDLQAIEENNRPQLIVRQRVDPGRLHLLAGSI